MRALLIVAGLVLVLGVTTFQIVRKEAVLRSGTTVLLELAPVDPRSLIQGDYMRLDYALARSQAAAVSWPRDGQLMVAVGHDDVARSVRRHTGGSLAPGEHLLRYRVRDRRLRIATDAYYFQEGHQQQFAKAKYGELKVDASGDPILVGLRDSNLRPLR